MCLLSLDRYMREVELIPSVHAINCARRRERSLVSFELDAQQAGVCAACSGRTRSSVLMVLSSAAFGGRRRPGSALGIQSNGAYRSAPCYSWGRPPARSSPRMLIVGSEQATEPRMSIYISLESDALGSSSPGPIYKPQPPPSPRRASFGIGDRESYIHAQRSAVIATSNTPGPRPLPSTFHVQCDSRKNTAPAPSFAGRGRAYSSLRIAAPGDATAPTWGSPRCRSDSRRPTSASFGFGKQERFVDRAGSLTAAAYSLPPPPGKYRCASCVRPAIIMHNALRPCRSSTCSYPLTQNHGYSLPLHHRTGRRWPLGRRSARKARRGPPPRSLELIDTRRRERTLVIDRPDRRITCPRSAITPLVSRCSRVESTAVASALAILSVSRSTSNREMSSRHLVLERTSLDGCPGSAWMWGRKSFMHNTQRYF